MIQCIIYTNSVSYLGFIKGINKLLSPMLTLGMLGRYVSTGYHSNVNKEVIEIWVTYPHSINPPQVLGTSITIILSYLLLHKHYLKWRQVTSMRLLNRLIWCSVTPCAFFWFSQIAESTRGGVTTVLPLPLRLFIGNSIL